MPASPKCKFPRPRLRPVLEGEEALEGSSGSEGIGAQSSRDPGKKLGRSKSPCLELQLEVMESRRSRATAVGQRLLQAETPGKKGLRAVSSGQVGRAFRWFTTVVLNAAFLGMVRAGA